MLLTDTDYPETEIIAAAIRFVNSTASHIYTNSLHVYIGYIAYTWPRSYSWLSAGAKLQTALVQLAQNSSQPHHNVNKFYLLQNEQSSSSIRKMLKHWNKNLMQK